MGIRAVILAILGGTFIATAGYFNDQIPRLNHFVGNEFPIVVFFPLIVGAALLNPLLARLHPALRFSKAELAAIVALLLVTCSIPGSGLLRWWSRDAGVPVAAQPNHVAWNKTHALDYAPRFLLANDGRYDAKFAESFWQGAGTRGSPIGFSEVPWDTWRRPMIAWMPLVFLVAAASICLALMVYRVWATRERLPYPVAQLATSVIEGADSPDGPLFVRRTFLVGAIAVFAIHVVNGLDTFFNHRLVSIPMEFDFCDVVLAKFPDLWQVPWGGNSMFHFPIWPAMVALACFVASDVSFSIGISVFVWTIVGFWMWWFGVQFGWIWTAGGVVPWQTAGSAIAIGLTLVYLGRRFYAQLFARAIGAGAADEVRPYEVWACRIFLLCAVAIGAILIAWGVAWPLAVLAVLLLFLMHVVVARITVESGMFLVHMQWQPLAVLFGVFGAEAMGLHAIAVLGMIMVVFTFEPREILMPFVLNGLRVCDVQRVPRGRVAGMGMGVFVLALAAAVPFSLWVDHNFGVRGGENFSTNAAPKVTFDLIATQCTLMTQSETLDRSESYSGFQRLWNMQPDPACLISLAAGAAVVFVLMALRLRFTWWPIHPILFLLWGTWGMRVTAFSFLLGWAIKTVTFRFGWRYQTLKTFMIGVIAGDLGGGVLWMIVGAIYFLVTGEKPPRYHVFPGG